MKTEIKRLLALIILMTLPLTGCRSETVPVDSEDLYVLSVGALKGPTGMGIIKLCESPVVDLDFYGSADGITPKLINGELDVACLPANLASVLYNKTGEEIITLAVNTLGVLYILEMGDEINSLSDLKGKTIVSAGAGSTPEYALRHLLKGAGIDPDSDLTLDFYPEHQAVLEALAAKKAEAALLPEPFVTAALNKAEGLRVALDLNNLWSLEFDGDALITGVVVARRSVLEKYPEEIKRFLSAYRASVAFVNDNVDEAAKMIGEAGIIDEEVARYAIPGCNLTFIEGKEMKIKLSGYLNTLYEANLQAVGGELPGDDFYYIGG